MRQLLVTRRTVPLDRADDYAVAWARLLQAAAEAGGRAWVFRRSGHEDTFLEFLEWTGGEALPEQAAVAEAVAELAACGAAHAGELWEEAGLE